MVTYIMGLYYLKETYYSVAGQYSEALKMVDAMMNDSTPIRSKYMDYKLVREQGNIYWKMGDKLKAAEFYYDYIAATDSVRTKELQNSATEFSSILELEQLKNERNELQCSERSSAYRLFGFDIRCFVLDNEWNSVLSDL